MTDQTMREYVDSILGKGYWDAMHDDIDADKLGAFAMPPVNVDGSKVRIFPGTNREVTLAAVKAEIRKAIKQVEDGRAEEVFDDSWRDD